MVSKINIFVIATMAIIMIGISIYSNENILEVMVLTTLIVSLIIIVLNLTFIIISSIKKDEVNKKSSIKTFIIAILTFILSIGLSGHMYENKSTVSKKDYITKIALALHLLQRQVALLHLHHLKRVALVHHPQYHQNLRLL